MKKNYISKKTEFVLELFLKQKYILLLATLIILPGNFTIAQTTTINITATGANTWTVPLGVSGSIIVEAWGAGGSGGGATGKDKGGSGGTGGTYVRSTFTGVTSGTVYTLFIAPSTAGTSASDGTSGQGTWFNTSGTLFANGGLGGLVGNGAARTAVTTGSIGTMITVGGSTLAGTATLGSAGGVGANGGGAGGASVGPAGNNSVLNGNPGTTAGGGGSGSNNGGGSCGSCSSAGGAGAQGQIKITFTCPANAGTLSGTQTICLGDTTTFSSTVLGGSWSSSNTGIATINSSTGVITAVSAGGPVTMTYTLAGGSCTIRTATRTLTVNILSIAPTSITGTSSICVGQSTTLTLSGGTAGTGATAQWFSDSCGGTLVGTGNAITVSPSGTTTYYVRYNGTCNTTTCVSVTVTVNALPVLSAITGTTSVCIGSTTTLANSTPGGTWNSASTGVATINASGLVSSVSAGTSLITYTYTNGNGCTSSVNTTVTINALPVVSSPASVCIGNTAQLTPNSDGTWTSSNNALATVDNTGLVNGVAVGSPTFTFTNSTTNCSKTTNAVNVLALPAISSQPLAAQTICSGSSVSFSVSATGPGLTYQWYNGATALSNVGSISGTTGPTLTINPVTLGDASANYNCVVSGTCSPAAPSANAELIVIEKVTITSQPAATKTLCASDTATFLVAATGAGISFQWYKGATALTDGGAISGATSATLTINPIVPGDAATNYNCVVSGTSPCTAVTSNNAALVVNLLPAITSQPAASQTLCSGSSVSLTVTATGYNLTYQWFNGATPITNGGSVTGATTATLTINPVSTLDASSNYKCVVSGSCSPSVSSNDAQVIVNQVVVITSQPILTQTVCAGSPATFSVTATGTGLSYLWYKGAVLLNNGGSVSGATSATLTINPVVTGDAVTNYKCVVSGASPCAAVTSNNAALVVNQLPAITSQPAASQTVCSGSSVSFSVIATGAGLTYQWYNGATVLSNGGSVTGATTATLTINPMSVSDASSNYNCVVSGSCSPSATSNNAQIIVNQVVAITSQPSLTQTVCAGSPATFSVTATGTGLSYQWYKGAVLVNNGGSISGATSATLTINPVVTGDAATNYRCVVSGTSPCAAVTSNNAALVVNQLPAITSQPAASQSICSGNSVSFSVTATGSNLTYQWFNAATPMANGGSVSGATTATLTINPVSSSDASSNYNCVVSGSCSPSATSNNATLIIISLSVGGSVTITHTANSSGTLIALPSPVSTHTDCHFSSGTLALNGQTGAVLRWESTTDAGNTWLNLGGAGNNTFNYTNAAVTTIFRAVVQNASCNITYSTAAILFVIPNIKPLPVSASPSTICIGEFTTLTSLSGYSSSQNIQNGGLFNNANPAGWLVDGNGVFSASADNGNPTTFKETNGNAGSEYDTTSNDKFAMARGNLDSTLQTPIFDLFGLSSANLTFKHAHKLIAGAWGKVELSFNGGATYPVTLATYTGNQGPYNQFNTAVSINLNAYLGYTNLRIRFNYHGLQAKSPGIDGDAWVIDDVNIPQAPVPALTSLWTDITSNTTVSVTNATNLNVYPTVTTTYAVTSFLNGCTSYGPEGTTYVTVTVNQLPVVTASPTTSCSGDVNSIALSSAVAGTQTSTTFAWTVAQTDATGGSAGSGSSINQTLTATGTVQGTVTYTITPTANRCIGPTRTIIARVNPRPKADIQPSQTICYGGTATFSVALEGTGPWNLTYSNGVSTTTVNGITTNPYIFSVSGMTVNRTFTITALSDSRCSARPQDLTGAAVVTVLNGTPGLWTGLVSTDWFDCKNWEGGLPSSTIDAQIPTITNSGRMPVIDRTSPFAAAYSFIATARDIIIATSASVTMVATNNSELQISRDWRNSGIFIPGTGTVTFNGSTLNQIQNINVGIKTNEAFYNLTLNNSNSAKGISVVDGFELTVANDLSLVSGDLRLVGEAQIVQNGTAANPLAGTGKILKDQQGTRNSFNYNYWSSPVTTNGTNYSIGGVLRDGTDSATNPFNPSAITFGAGAYFADGAITTPVKVSTRWLFKYTSVSTVYAGWQYIGNTGTVNIGEGYTMKGVTGIAPFTTPQNYVFIGKPNNGIIPLSISLNQSFLVGNPYPSALDADEFIKDNIKDGAGRAATNIFNGALYFWDHFGGQTHILNQYIGGYSSYTLMGGVVAISNDPLVNANGAMGTRVPKQYIPVAQGFFIGTGSNAALTGNNPSLSTAVTGGTINFKNSQRTFKIESASNSVFFKSTNHNQTVSETIDTRQKIRLVYQSPSNIHRQILVGVDESASGYFDVGYDAPIVDENDEDLYWKTSDAKLIIQAVSNFNQDQILPLGLKIATAGICTIKVNTLENISNDTQLYIHDAETGTDYDVKNSDFTISLPIGIYQDRFSLRFSGSALGTNNPYDINTFASISNHIIKIQSIEFIKEISLYDITGKLINSYSPTQIENQFSDAFNYPNGVYIAKITLDNDVVVTKKLIH